MTTSATTHTFHTHPHLIGQALMALMLWATACCAALAQNNVPHPATLPHSGQERFTLTPERLDRAPEHDTIAATAALSAADTAMLMARPDTLPLQKRQKRDWATWRPNAKKAMWLAIVLPGAGQIYNRKYWKLPIVYGGFVGCAYALRWNNQMYRDYSQAYMDLMDNDPNTQSYNQFLHLGVKIDDSNIERYKTLFKNRKDRFRRWRDLSVFCMIGVYALSIVDAYVDASLSEFDISDNLSLKVEPTLINNATERNPLKQNSLGLSCSLNF